MRKPVSPSHHTLGALDQAIGKEINSWFPAKLLLIGEKPDDWPDTGTSNHQTLVQRIKAGLAFYCMEDFLWPIGREKKPTDIWVGHTLRKSTRYLFKLGEQGLPDLNDVLWTPRETDVQPVAMTSYNEASCYHRTGALLERRFLPLLNPKWCIRENLLEKSAIAHEFHNRFRFKELYYFGDYPSRVAEGMGAEIRYVLNTNNIEPRVPPSAAIKKAFQRQLKLLREAWLGASDGRGKPTIEWVRQRLLHPEYPEHIIENGYADRYRKALLNSLVREDTDRD